ncbi:MAG TPA: hypothetical protein VIF64_09330 [Pyrinomonadaceae bacterium]
MKLCPQCEFIYEDDQTLCDMDGRELVYDQEDPLAYEKAVAWSPQETQYTYDRGSLAGEEIVGSSHLGIHDTYDRGSLAGEETVVSSHRGIHDTYDPGPLASEETVVSSAVDIHDTYDPGSAANEETVVSSPPEIDDTLEIPATAPSELPVSQPKSSHFRRNAFASLAAILLVALLFVVYYARTRQARLSKAHQASNQNSTQSSDLLTQVARTAQEASDLVSAQSETEVSSLEESSSDSEDVTTSSSVSSEAPLGRGRLINPVSAGGSSASNRPPVVVWLANGSSIKADEAWEKKEGIWYRQGGMVTFLKRSRVRSIQRLATPNQASKSVAIKAAEPSRKRDNVIAQNHAPDNIIAQNQSRIGSENNSGARNRKPENTIAQNRPVAKPGSDSTGKDSKVTSFLKRTGRILKRPFQF